jgi:heavy metal sensor kinase
MFRRSLRARLTLWYTAVLALVLVSFAAVSYAAIARATRRSVDESLRHAAGSLAAAIRQEASDDEDDEEDDEGEEEEDGSATAAAPGGREVALIAAPFRLGDFRLFVYDEAGGLLAASGADGQADVPPRQVEELLATAEQSGSTFASLPDDGAGTRAFAVREATAQGAYTVVAARSLDERERQLAEVLRAYAVAIPFAVVLAALGGSLLARKSLSRVVDMGEQAEHIEATSLHERLRVANEHDEIGRLARVFNALLGRLEASFEQQRRFMADASHELRTPVAIVRGEAEVALSRRDRGARDYRESLDVIHDEGKRLAAIVEDLFLLARADAGERPLVESEFYLDEVVCECVRAVRSLAERRGVRLACGPAAEMPFRGDEALVRRLLVNLLDNAIKYTPNGGEVRVHMERGTEYVVTIADTGCGVPAEAGQLVFERFFRVDKARARAGSDGGSGAGLGLSIARWIAEAHGGRVELVRSSDRGSTFAVTLPVPDEAP